MSMSMRETMSSVDRWALLSIKRGLFVKCTSHRRSTELKAIAQHELKRPNAAVGQSGLMSLYEAMFRSGEDLSRNLCFMLKYSGIMAS